MTAQPVGTAPHVGRVSYEQPPRGRLARLFQAADRRHVPLRTILVTAAVVVATYLAGKVGGRACAASIAAAFSMTERDLPALTGSSSGC